MYGTWISFTVCCSLSFILNKLQFYQDNIDIFSVCFIAVISFFVFKDILIYYKNECKSIILSYIFRLFLLYVGITYHGSSLQLPNDVDSDKYHICAVQILRGMTPYYDNYYSKLLSSVYYVFGVSRIIGQYLNILFSLTTIHVISLTLKKIKINDKLCSLGVKIVSLLPGYAILSAILLRESIIILLLACSTYCIVCWLKDSQLLYFLYASLFCGCAAIFHGGSITPLMAYIVIFVLYDRKKHQIKFSIYQKFLVAVAFFAFLMMFASIEDFSISFMEEAESAKDARESEKGGATYIVGVDISNPILNFVVNTPIRVFYYLLSPMPWDWRGINDIFCFIFSSSFYTIGFILTIKVLSLYGKTFLLRKYLLATLLIMSMSSIIFSWGVSNSGTAMRHRDKFIAPYIVMAMTALNLYSNKKNCKILGIK